MKQWELWKFPYPSANRPHWFVILSPNVWCENANNPVINPCGRVAVILRNPLLDQFYLCRRKLVVLDVQLRQPNPPINLAARASAWAVRPEGPGSSGSTFPQCPAPASPGLGARRRLPAKPTRHSPKHSRHDPGRASNIRSMTLSAASDTGRSLFCHHRVV